MAVGDLDIHVWSQSEDSLEHLRQRHGYFWCPPEEVSAEHRRQHALLDDYARAGDDRVALDEIVDAREFLRLSGLVPGWRSLVEGGWAQIRPGSQSWARGQYYAVLRYGRSHQLAWRSGVMRRTPQLAKAEAQRQLEALKTSPSPVSVRTSPKQR